MGIITLPLRMSAAQELLDTYGGKINSELTKDKYDLNNMISILNKYKDNMTQLASQAYSRLGFQGDLKAQEAACNEEIKSLRATVSSLNGIDLDKIFLEEVSKALQFDVAAMQQKNYQILLNKIESDIKEQLENEGPKEIYQELFARLDNTFAANYTITSSGRVTAKRAFTKNGKKVHGGQFIGSFDTLFYKIGKSTREKILDYMKENKESLKNFNQEYDTDSFSTTWLLENVQLESFLTMNPKERRLFFQTYPGIKESINESMKQKIISNCKNCDYQIMSQVIDSVLAKRDDIFFGGGNTRKVLSGVLGEIQALYYIKKLTGKTADWIGGVDNPHADILLTDALASFGIQVKNSSLEGAEQEVSFKSFNLGKGRTFTGNGVLLESTQKGIDSFVDMGGNEEILTSVQQILAMETFNVEYIKEPGSKVYQKGDNATFHETRMNIEIMAKKANRLMQLFAVAAMYMQMENINSKKYNTLYLIAGQTMISSATIISQIIEDLEKEVYHFKTKMINRTQDLTLKNQRTIVDYFNSTKSRHKMNFRLQTSYTFEK